MNTMKNLSVGIILLLALLISIPVPAQNAADQQNQPKEERKKTDRAVIYKSTGKARLKAGETKIDNYALERFLTYSAIESKTGRMHLYELYDGDDAVRANTKPDRCRVTNEDTGEVVDEYTNEYTCDKHFGDAPYRQVIDKLVSAYAAKYRDDIQKKVGVLTIKPASGKENIYYKSASQIIVTLEANDVSYTAISNMGANKEVQQTHTFIVKDMNIKKKEVGPRIIQIKEDFSEETQKIIKDLVKFAVENSDIWDGSRKEHISSQSDILGQF